MVQPTLLLKVQLSCSRSLKESTHQLTHNRRVWLANRFLVEMSTLGFPPIRLENPSGLLPPLFAIRPPVPPAPAGIPPAPAGIPPVSAGIPPGSLGRIFILFLLHQTFS